MTTTLRQVLDHFDRQPGAIALPQMARALGIERAVLQDMIAYWVRRGELRPVALAACTTCGTAIGCPFAVKLPLLYERVRKDAPPEDPPPTCGCGGCQR
ncbi:MAG: FeoC-like transcriptional regulator [Anaerolinea sp.]|nr:FeoC-like transcriptional regulator [Anaerolinea sp.]